MARYDLILTLEDQDGDDNPEVTIEFHVRQERPAFIDRDYVIHKLDYAAFVSSSQNDGVYDKVTVGADADGDGDYGDRQDNNILRDLANAFVRIHLGEKNEAADTTPKEHPGA
ncbi:hypothetical protein [Pseudomonas ovata]|uniref:hypothetical protein n=1 Tax=Pseudomonas ovata TaxID=1839709 RepID=UPI000D6971F3|nr:hypothetical protein [Pseudomonas ovata]